MLATLGAGCFWGVEKCFRRKFPQLKSIKVGYAGGHTSETDYRTVCTGKTGHAEIVHMEFDPAVYKYEDILDFFFRMHDPTTVNKQGGDTGTQYRSAIFYHSPEQKEIAAKVLQKAQGPYKGKVVTTLEEFKNYVQGEEYHQEYLEKNPHGYECATHFERTWEKIDSLFK